MDFLAILFRWVHILSGIMWVGLLFWFNFMYMPFVGVIDGPTRSKVLPELVPRALYFFRFSAIWTWVTGLLLLMLVFYHAQQIFPSQDQSWTAGGWVMLAVTFLIFFVYDPLAKSGLGKNTMAFGAVSLVIVGIVAFALYSWAGFGYRAYQIHLGTMFGTVMIMNVWMRLWPAQKKIFAAMKAGTPPDASLMELVGQRSKHNVYLSVPLVFTMINMHTTSVGEENWWAILVVMAVAWLGITWIYSKSMAVKGL